MLKDSDLINLWLHLGDKGSFKDRFVSTIIKIFTYEKSIPICQQASHCEIEFPEWVREEHRKELNCFSSRGMDEPRGVYFKKIKFSHPDRWIKLPVLWLDTTADIIRAYKEAESHIGEDYDFSVIPRFGLGLDVDNKRKWWCSEICAKILIPGLTDNNVSPNELHKMAEILNRPYIMQSTGFLK